MNALVEILAEQGPMDLSYADLAKRAGVSIPTVYRHFPTRDTLFEALSKRVNAVIALREIPRTREGVGATVRALFPRFDQHEQLVRAQLQAGSTGARQSARNKRVGVFDHALAAALPALPEKRRRAVAGLFTCLVSAAIWQRLRDEAGLDGEQGGEVTAWAVETLWRALELEAKRA